MQEKARVIGIEDDVVSVAALDIAACLGCTNSDCRTSGSVFFAINRLKLDIHTGSEVRIAAPAKKQLQQALFAIGLPLVLAVAAYCASFFLFSGVGEGVCTAAALIALVCGVILVSVLSRSAARDLPEIIEVL